MAKYRKKPKMVEATQWFKNGDHPEDGTVPVAYPGGEFLSEGKVVRLFRHPDVRGEKECPLCCCSMDRHGWMDFGDFGQTVCPGDYVITTSDGRYYRASAARFESEYELAEDTRTATSPETDS